jgi:hypothetical protein
LEVSEAHQEQQYLEPVVVILAKEAVLAEVYKTLTVLPMLQAAVVLVAIQEMVVMAEVLTLQVRLGLVAAVVAVEQVVRLTPQVLVAV